MLTRRLFGAAAALLAIFGGALASAETETSDLEAVKERGVLRIGVAQIAPWIIDPGLGGDFIGYEMESTKRLAEHLGVEREFVRVPFGQLAYALRDGKFDMIASGYSMSEDRRAIIDFSLPYNRTAYKLVMSKAAAGDKNRVRDFNRREFRIGYVLGGLSDDVAKAQFPRATLTPFEVRADGVRALVDGEIDGFVGSDPFYTAVVRARPDDFTIPIKAPLLMSIEAFAVRKGQDDFLDVLNAWVVEEEQAGVFKDLHARWFDDLLWLSVFQEMDRARQAAPAAGATEN